MSRKLRGSVWLSISYVLLAAIGVFSVYPALWVIMSSLRTGNSLFSETLFPTAFTLEHYANLFSKYDFALWYTNTLKIALITTVIGTVLTLLPGYAFSIFRFTGRKTMMSTLMVLGLFPGFMSMIAIFILLNLLNLLNTHLAVILVYAAGAPLFFLFAKSYFDTIPKSLVEAARIDGAGHLSIFFRIVMPLSTPLIVYTALSIFAGSFTDFLFAKLVLRTPETKTLAVGLFDMISSRQATDFTSFAAGCVLIAVPITFLFILLQRLLTEGLTAGAEKG
ncbi:arabinogalactan oligomer/maltooligosaccharide transport system permease protein [Paenibacillus forsythiae]|uniref:Arabinogalactan oligomer/maltooligosaccharide transport system permease protein n=1 Tax=Paenibacillus forsythiae TaxID=365616 RepID=A0ABU3H9M0_9BACL|nr:sugar ABC transporter permease [Paenibacillus forsythiae]MDT3427504.1 arabinogalactan oligomer/maltooligosaccharide transport system permease protein [Paenibacillus forsythiae]